MLIKFDKLPELINDEFYPFLFDDNQTEVFVGGANSGKSYFVAQKIIYKTIAEKGHRWLACRKVKKDVRHSCYDLLKHTINSFGFGDLFRVNDTETIITCKLNGNDIIGVGLDDVNKLKSFFDPTDFWLEEADQATEADYNQLLLRLRGDVPFIKQGMLSLNPIWAGHWIKKRFFDRKEENVITHRSTYRTNKFLDKASIKTLESITDPYFKMVYADGEWGVYGNVVFSNYVIEKFNYTIEDLENPFVGMDFGYNHASAIILGGFKDGEMYIVDELYGKGWTNANFIENAKEFFGDTLYQYEIVADSAEPDRIEEWEKQGYRMKPAKKGPGSIRYGIDFLLRFRIHVHEERCINTGKELQIFKRKENREGEATDDFVELNDDCIACLTGDTIVNTTEGDFKIKDLVGKEGKVYSYDGNSPCVSDFSSVSLTRYRAKVYTIELEDGSAIEATEDHPILTTRGWILVKDLTDKDKVIKIETEINSV